jgi:dTDP-4-dehydrorhamnose reductase
MKVLLIGANGQLGSDLAPCLRARGAEVKAFRHSELDVCDPTRVEEAVAAFGPDFLISTAAYHKVEECEKNPEPSFRVNASAVRDLAQICERHSATLVHFSTDYVFGRDAGRTTPYLETDAPGPVNVYGVSKAAGELMVPFNASRYYLLRVCGLYGIAGSSGKGGNFVETMLKKAAENTPIRVVDDQVLTPTATILLADAVTRLIEARPAYGLYHMTCEGQCSWYEFARAIFELSGISADLSPVKTAAFPGPVQRPAYSVLSKSKLRAAGITMPEWKEGLERYLAARRGKATVI